MKEALLELRRTFKKIYDTYLTVKDRLSDKILSFSENHRLLVILFNFLL